MREIRFRAWDNDRFIYIHLTEDALQVPVIGGDKRRIWQQYTGLHDKNGVEIYEGDILDFAYNGGEIKGPVEWSARNAAFGIKNGDYYEMLNGILSIEVIGTIYENKELLK